MASRFSLIYKLRHVAADRNDLPNIRISAIESLQSYLPDSDIIYVLQNVVADRNDDERVRMAAAKALRA
jgi:hypothetical protein